MFKWEDPGRAMERELEAMTKEELQDALVEAREYERIYDRFYTAVMELVNSKKNGEMFVSKRLIDCLNNPVIGGEYNDIQWELICRLKSEFAEVVKTLGFVVEEDNGYRLPAEEIEDATKDAHIVKYLSFSGKSYYTGEKLTVVTDRGCITGKLNIPSDIYLEPEIKLIDDNGTGIFVKICEIKSIEYAK